jgi:hypothetical protein
MTEEKDSSALTTPQDNDLATLTHSIIEWRRLKEDNDIRKQQVRESTTKMKALEEIILRVMKSHNIGALDLKNSGGRVFFKTKKSSAGVGQKGMVKLMGDYLKSADEAVKLMDFIQSNRQIVTKETIHYEKTV